MRSLVLAIVIAATPACSSRPVAPTLVEARAIELYADGASVDELATSLTHGDRAAARDLLYHGLLALQRRYYHDR